jgi:hypothetical protein
MITYRPLKEQKETVTYTDVEGNRIVQEWDLFDLDLVRAEVKKFMINHIRHSYGFRATPLEDKLQYYQDNMFFDERQITNFKYLSVDFPQYEFSQALHGIEEYKEYQPILNDTLLLKTNNLSKEFTLSIGEEYSQLTHFLEEYFPLEWYTIPTDSKHRIIPKASPSQSDVDNLFDKCLSDVNYELSEEEVKYIEGDNYSTQSSRWVENKLKERNTDKHTYFSQFEIVLRNTHQPTYKLMAVFNPNLSMNPLSVYHIDYSKVELDGSTTVSSRGKALEVNIHRVVLDKVREMFVHWFRNKHADFRKETLKEEGKVDKYEVTIAVVVIGGVEHLLSRLKETEFLNLKQTAL